MHHCLLLIIHVVFIGITSSFGQFYPIHEMTVDLKIGESEVYETKVQSCSISNLITVKEFNIYLQKIKKDSSAFFYKSQLPSSRTINEKMVDDILKSSSLQNEPMPGVSWTVARNYCIWLSNQSKLIGLNYQYDLPLVSEIIALNKLYEKNDLNQLESWTLNCYDESMQQFLKSLSYQYNAEKSDPPAMKRKIIFGGSYHMNYKPSQSSRAFQYEYQDSSSRFIGFRVVRKIKNVNFNTLSIKDNIVDYCLYNNHLDGIYQEKYSNEKLKVLGTFLNGQRTGIWTIWDSTGSIIIQRNYQNNKTCDFLFPVVNNPYKEIYNLYPEYILHKNDQNIFPYRYVEERAVVYSQRIRRELNLQNEPNLFRNIDFKILVQKLFKSDAKWYEYGEYGDIKFVVQKDSLPSLEFALKTWDFNRIEIKEDFFFNVDNLISDTRQISISFYKNIEDIKPSYTLYYPWVRSIMSNIEVVQSEMPEIKTLDDIFFFHAYRGDIISCGNMFLSEKTDNLDQNDLNCELEQFINEHDLWINYGR